MKTKKPIATNGRREDYVRLPFVDDLCLRSAMQNFLRRKPSSEAKLTERQTIQGHAYQGKMGLHVCVPEIFGLVAFS